jgi:hypothetical protein
LGELRAKAAALRDQGMDYPAIGKQLGISAIRARDFSRQYDRFDTKITKIRQPGQLSRRATNALLRGRYATEALKAGWPHSELSLLEIAASYTCSELRTEKGIGSSVFKEIEAWLQWNDRNFRRLEFSTKDALNEAVRQMSLKGPHAAIQIFQSRKTPHETGNHKRIIA